MPQVIMQFPMIKTFIYICVHVYVHVLYDDQVRNK